MSWSSASRFADRARAVRRLRWRPVLQALATLLLLAAAGWVLVGSPWLRVADVEVRGLERVAPAAVEAVAAAEVGRPLALADTRRVRDGVAALPLVAEVAVSRSWPGTLVVEVAERQPVAAVPAAGGGVELVDADGVVLVAQAEAPPDLPVVDVDVRAAGAASVNAAIAVLGGLPEALRAEVASTAATSPDAVQLRLRTGQQVVWGSAERGAAKADALSRLRVAAAEAGVLDVSAPEAPVAR